jgi:UrcA family protein
MSTPPIFSCTFNIAAVFAASVFQLASVSAIADSAAPDLATIGQPPVINSLDRDVPRVVVSYGDLDMSSLVGFQTLDSRLRDAVRQVCRNSDIRDLSGAVAVAECRRTALEGALADLRQAGEGMNAFWLRWRAEYAWGEDEAISYD